LIWRRFAAEATQGQMDDFLSQLPYKCHAIYGRLTQDLPSTQDDPPKAPLSRWSRAFNLASLKGGGEIPAHVPLSQKDIADTVDQVCV